MNDSPPIQEFLVLNRIRQACLILLVVECLLLVFVFCTIEWFVAAAAIFVSSLLALAFVDSLVLKQRISFLVSGWLSNRIKFNSEGIEFLSGRFGEHWQRPHEEFLIEFRGLKYLLWLDRHELRLRHKVLGTYSFYCSDDRDATYELFRSLASQFQVKAYRSSKSVDV